MQKFVANPENALQMNARRGILISQYRRSSCPAAAAGGTRPLSLSRSQVQEKEK